MNSTLTSISPLGRLRGNLPAAITLTAFLLTSIDNIASLKPREF